MLILLHGPDEFSAHEELARLKTTEDFGYNTDTFSGVEISLDTILATCDTLPFLSERRLVVVEGLPKRKRATKEEKEDKESDDSAGGASSKGQAPADAAEAAGGKGTAKKKKGKSATGSADPKAFAQGLADHVTQMPDSTLLVVLVDETLDATHPLVQAAQKHGKIKAYTPPRGAQLETWLTRRASAAGARLAPDAARLLATEGGDSLRVLAGEIEKLSTYVGKGGEIHVHDVRALTPASHQARVFDLTDALARRDRTSALALLHELLDSGESPLGIVALTAFQTRALLQVKALSERGMRVPQIAQAAGMAPFLVEKSLPLVRQFSFAQLEAAHRMLLDIDASLKRSKMTPELALDLLVIEFGTVAL